MMAFINDYVTFSLSVASVLSAVSFYISCFHSAKKVNRTRAYKHIHKIMLLRCVGGKCECVPFVVAKLYSEGEESDVNFFLTLSLSEGQLCSSTTRNEREAFFGKLYLCNEQKHAYTLIYFTVLKIWVTADHTA